MWEFGTAAASIAALLVPAAPGQAPPLLPPSEPAPGCVVPVGSVLDHCPRGEVQPPVLCILPVTGFSPTPVEPACPDPVPDPRGHTFPITP